MDDIYIICDNKYDVNHLLKAFNNCHSLLNFILEFENKQSIHFHDDLIKKTRRNSKKIHLQETFVKWLPVRFSQLGSHLSEVKLNYISRYMDMNNL